MDDLIAKLEAATEGSRELDVEIAEEFVLGKEFNRLYPYMHELRWALDHYTTSIDAALTLVPDGWAFEMVMCGEEVPVMVRIFDKWPETEVTVSGQTPALAICIAALKARQE